uniref:Uncharacterized protein n=1 Tax=Tanacetum cinerariifolium TaxID=118510 RepID=A0A699V280_TANCI|nr:hypothetical protein [Tanacetum cinerariifolium]
MPFRRSALLLFAEAGGSAGARLAGYSSGPASLRAAAWARTVLLPASIWAGTCSPPGRTARFAPPRFCPISSCSLWP